MKSNELLIAEFQQEGKATRRILERVPDDKYDWKPHEKSMTLKELASHIAEIPGWTPVTIEQDELDFSKFEYKPPVVNNNADLLKVFDENLEKAIEVLKRSGDEKFSELWTMRSGDQVYFSRPKIQVIRDFAMSHLYHHRGQLTVYLRLLGVPVPMIYGPTADEAM